MASITRIVSVAAVAVVVTACSSSSGGSSGVASTDTSLGASTPASLPEEAPGAGTGVIDGVTYEFDVSGCEFGTIDDADPGTPITLFELDGGGIGPGGEPFTVRVTRVYVLAAAEAFTDRVVVDQPALDFRVVAERVESDGLIIDLRDPTAAQPLLRLGDRHVSASGVFGPSGGTTDDITLQGTFSAGCPAP